jgi:S1-C subfamily serine protease
MNKRNKSLLNKKYSVSTIIGLFLIFLLIIGIIMCSILLFLNKEKNLSENTLKGDADNNISVNLSLNDVNNIIVPQEINVEEEMEVKIYSTSEIYQMVKDSMFFVETVCDLEVIYPSFKIDYKADKNDNLEIKVSKSTGIKKMDDFSGPFEFTGSGFLLNNKIYTNYHVIDCETEYIEDFLKEIYYSLVEYHLHGYLDKDDLEEVDFDFNNKIKEIYDYFYKSRIYNYYYEEIIIEDLLVAKISEYLSENISVKKLGGKVYAYHESDKFTNSIDLDLYKLGASFPERDFAIFNLSYNTKNLISNDDYEFVIGDEIYIIGFPSIEVDFYFDLESYDVKKEAPIISKGIISGLRESRAGVKYYVVDAAAYYGSSGGPVINKHGEVIGILTAGIESFNFILPLSEIDLDGK